MFRVIFLLSVIWLSSCVSDSSYNQAIAERDKYKQELEDLKFSAPSLLADAKRFFSAKDFDGARVKLQKITTDYPDRPEAAEAKALLLTIDEEQSWANAGKSDALSETQQYIDKYPIGKYQSKAVARLQELIALKERTAYELATQRANSTIWKGFLNDYPNRPDAEEIKRRIIKLEVDEILAGKHGDLPANSANYGSSESSSQSTVRITNNTGETLTVRYSGPDVRSVVISPSQTSTINLPSGQYRVAASVPQANYGGVENLSGDYSSSFYLETHTSYQTHY